MSTASTLYCTGVILRSYNRTICTRSCHLINSHSQLVTVKISSLKVINSHSQLLAQGCCYRFPARSQLFQHGHFLQLSEMESGDTAHEMKVKCNQYILQWYSQRTQSNAEGFMHCNKRIVSIHDSVGGKGGAQTAILAPIFPYSAINSKQSILSKIQYTSLIAMHQQIYILK